MEISTKTTIYYLTERSVDISTEQFVEINGTEVKLDTPKHLMPYYNSPLGRESLQNAGYSENVVNAVFEIWGDEPTVADPEVQDPEVTEPINTETENDT